MPEYTYYCESCRKKIDHVCSIRDYKEKIVCTNCKSDTFVYRLYSEDLASLNTAVKKSDNELKTVGDLANRNRDRMSDDQKQSLNNKHNSYKEQGLDIKLPTGMTHMQKPKTKKHKWT